MTIEEKQLEFMIYCIESTAERLGRYGSDVYNKGTRSDQWLYPLLLRYLAYAREIIYRRLHLRIYLLS